MSASKQAPLLDWPPELARAEVSLPQDGGAVWFGQLAALPEPAAQPPGPLLLFLHGSSGLNEQTRSYQRWLSGTLGLATLAPDSLARAARPRYQSPAPREVYEAVHRLRLDEIRAAMAALPRLPWVDARRVFLAGSSEGAVAVARWRGDEFLGRLIYSWPCEDNYFVDRADNGFAPDCPILNILSGHDPYFSADSPLNRGLPVLGHSGHALRDATHAKLLILPHAPHTLYNLPAARAHTRRFLRELLRNAAGLKG